MVGLEVDTGDIHAGLDRSISRPENRQDGQEDDGMRLKETGCAQRSSQKQICPDDLPEVETSSCS